MTIDKFGSHILNKNLPTSKAQSQRQQTEENIQFVSLNNIKLYYNLILPFVGVYNKLEELVELGQDKKKKYIFPLNDSRIIKTDFLQNFYLKINDRRVNRLDNVILKKGDSVSFHQNPTSGGTIKEFYGELIMQCPIIIVKEEETNT